MDSVPSTATASRGDGASAPDIWPLLRAALEQTWAHVRDPANRRHVVPLVTLLCASVVYATWRATWLDASDLTGGYLRPARGIFFEGKDPYVHFHFNSYSPFFYAVMAPLAPLPDGVASVVWTALNLLMLVGVFALVRSLVARAGWDPGAAWWGPALGAFIIADNLHLGQSNVLPLFCCCAAFHDVARGRGFRAGLLLSVAVAYKITPALLVLPLFARGRARAMAGLGAGTLACLGVVPVLAFGPQRGPLYVREWVDMIIRPFVTGQKVRSTNVEWHHTNQSMEAAVQRFLTPYGEASYGGLHRFTDPAFLDEVGASRVALALRLVLLVGLVVLVVRGVRVGNPGAVAWELALFPVAALFLSPISWFSHYVSAVVGYAVSAGEVARARASGAPARGLEVALGSAVVLSAVCWTNDARSYSPIFLGHAALFVAMYARAWRDQGSTRSTRLPTASTT